MTAVAAREVRFTDAFGPVGWGTSLLAVLLIHLAIAYYFLVYHQIKVETPPAAPDRRGWPSALPAESRP